MTTAAYSSLVERLENQGVKFQQDPGRNTIMASFKCDQGVFMVSGRADADLLQIHVRAPIAVPEGARQMIADAVHRANFGMKVGAFEFDMNDGELRFHASNILDNENVSDQLVGRMLATSLHMMDRYLPGFMSIIFANESPKEAIQRAEAA